MRRERETRDDLLAVEDRHADDVGPVGVQGREHGFLPELVEQVHAGVAGHVHEIFQP